MFSPFYTFLVLKVTNAVLIAFSDRVFLVLVKEAGDVTNSKTLTGMQQNVLIVNLIKRMEQGREYTARQMAEIAEFSPKIMKTIIHKMRVHGIIIKTRQERFKRKAPINVWKLNPIKLPKWVNSQL